MDTVLLSGDAGLDAEVPSSMQQQTEQFVVWVDGVFNDPFDLCPPCCVDRSYMDSSFILVIY